MRSDRQDYIFQMAIELAKLAKEERAEFLAYLLEMAAREAASPNVGVAAPISPALPDASYLREQANRFIQLAREHRDLPVAHDLEVISVELMEKAAQLDGFLAEHSRA